MDALGSVIKWIEPFRLLDVTQDLDVACPVAKLDLSPPLLAFSFLLPHVETPLSYVPVSQHSVLS